MGQQEPISYETPEQQPPRQSPASARSRAMLAWFGVDTDSLTTPSALSPRPDRGPSFFRTLAGALILAFLGAAIGVASGDTHFGWVGGLAAGAQLTAWTARSLGLARLATGVGLVAFFATVVLFLSALLVGVIAALPIVLQRLLG